MSINVEEGKQGFQEVRRSETSAPLPAPVHEVDAGGHWIVQKPDGTLVRQVHTRGHAEDSCAANPGSQVGLYIKGATSTPEAAVRMYRMSGDIAHALDNPDVRRVEFGLTFNEEYGHFEVNSLVMYDDDGTDITPNDDSYYAAIDTIESECTNDDLAMLANTMKQPGVKIR